MTSTDSSPSGTSRSELNRILDAAVRAEAVLRRTVPAQRGDALRAVASAVQGAASELVPLADSETSLGEARLAAELRRTTFQLEYFADRVESGTAEGDVVDPADPAWPPAARPDLRRRLVPVGVVAMFSASNFPFAFSVVGGDTASAWAAGCPVVVKAHSAHPRLSRRVAELARAALTDHGLTSDALQLVEGRDGGTALVLDDRVDAVAFTGSTSGGRTLFDLAAGRPRPIPFYGELGSVNPVFVTERAAHLDGARIWRELVESFTLGAGQFCTKPGLVFVPRSAHAAVAVTEHLGSGSRWRMLDQRIARAFADRVAELRRRPDVETVVDGGTDGIVSTPTVLRADIEDFLADPSGLGEECFGPTTLLIEYDRESELVAAAEAFTGELTASVQAVPDDPIVEELLSLLETRVGRLIWNQWPTGVSVTDAMQHGGPYPSSTSPRDTAVGGAAIARFQRPVAYQNFPERLLPEAVRR